MTIMPAGVLDSLHGAAAHRWHTDVVVNTSFFTAAISVGGMCKYLTEC
jgi:hypothetical protein